MTQQIKDQMEKLRNLIEYHNVKYFNESAPEIDDSEFDQLVEQLKLLEAQYPEYVASDSPTQRVGGNADVNTFAPVKHSIPMLSLGKAMSVNIFNMWLRKMVNDRVLSYVAEAKMDGLAVRLDYDDGVLIQASTRGDGEVGDDVTASVMSILAIPKKLSKPFNGQIRGEVFLRKQHLKEINDNLNAIGSKKVFANVRNAASGIFKRKEDSPERALLSFAAYTLIDYENDDYERYSNRIHTMKELGFETIWSVVNDALCIDVSSTDIESAETAFENFFKQMEQRRDSLDFDIDGIVIKADLDIDQQRLGEKIGSPNWAIAYKFPSQKKMTRLLSIPWTMGNKGNITPNSEIDPVEIGGTLVTGPTLHNLEELKRLDIMIGDMIIVSRRGDVIPKIESVVKEMRTGDEKPIEIPTHCPACGAPTVIDGPFLRCSAGDDCTYMEFAKIQNFVMSVEIEDFGPTTIEKMLEMKLIKDLVDIYDLTIEQVANIERMGKRSATKLVNNIQASKQAPFERVLMGLTIPNVGSETAKKIIDRYGNLINFLHNATVEDLISIDDIGPKTAPRIIEWLNKQVNKNLILRLNEKNIGTQRQKKQAASNKLEGKSFCFTGKMIHGSREDYETLVVDNGGTLSSVKKGLTYLVAGEKAGSKLAKANSLEIEVIDESTFIEMIK